MFEENVKSTKLINEKNKIEYLNIVKRGGKNVRHASVTSVSSIPAFPFPSAVSPAGLWFHVLHSQLPMKMRGRKPVASD